MINFLTNAANDTTFNPILGGVIAIGLLTGSYFLIKRLYYYENILNDDNLPGNENSSDVSENNSDISDTSLFSDKTAKIIKEFKDYDLTTNDLNELGSSGSARRIDYGGYFSKQFSRDAWTTTNPNENDTNIRIMARTLKMHEGIQTQSNLVDGQTSPINVSLVDAWTQTKPLVTSNEHLEKINSLQLKMDKKLLSAKSNIEVAEGIIKELFGD